MNNNPFAIARLARPEDISPESVLLLAERLFLHADSGCAVKQAACAVLLAGLESVLLPDADNQGVVNHRSNVGNLPGVDPVAPGVGGGDGGSGLRQLKAGCLSENSHGSDPSVEGSDKSARAVRTRSGRRLSNNKKSNGKNRRGTP